MPSLFELPDIMTIAQACEYLRISRSSIKRWEKQKRIKCIRINSRKDRRYLKKDIINFLNNG